MLSTLKNATWDAVYSVDAFDFEDDVEFEVDK